MLNLRRIFYLRPELRFPEVMQRLILPAVLALVGWMALAEPGHAQPNQPRESQGSIDSLKHPWRRAIPAGERFNLVFRRSFLLTNTTPDTVPIRTALSGNYFVAGGFNLLIARHFTIRLQPGVSFFNVAFGQQSRKRFPSKGDSLQREKILATYGEGAVLLSWVIKRDEVTNKAVYHWDIGAQAGYNINHVYRTVLEREDGQVVKSRLPGRWSLDPLRLGLMSQINYKSVGFYAYYRLSQFFVDRQYRAENGLGRGQYPELPKLELGLALSL
jgi:hypothetical protein